MDRWQGSVARARRGAGLGAETGTGFGGFEAGPPLGAPEGAGAAAVSLGPMPRPPLSRSPLHARLSPGAAADDPSAPLGLRGLAALLPGLPPSCGPVRLVGVDGHAGSGKTTFAGWLADALGGAPVLHLDDVASHDAFFDWTGRLREQVLTPLSRGHPARYEVYDWVTGDFSARPPRVLPPDPVVLVEGVGAGRRALRPHLAALVWLDLSPARSWERGMRRDGPALAGFWDAWTRAERAHFGHDPSRPQANFLVCRGQEGYEVRAGPAGSLPSAPGFHRG